MRLLTWNVARRLQKLDAQAAAVVALAPDVAVLQEVTAASLPRWRAALGAAGYASIVCPLDAAEPLREPPGPRRTGVLAAGREPLETLPPPAVPWPETVCAVRAGGIEVVGAHVPNSANGWTKVRTLQALRAHVEERSHEALAVCGDLNTPRRESAADEIVTFARDRYGRLRPERGEEWDEAERALLDGSAGLRDAFREVHGYAVKEPSWTWRRYPGGYRLDHVLVSGAVTVRDCFYVHDLRQSGLSDHSGLIADLA